MAIKPHLARRGDVGGTAIFIDLDQSAAPRIAVAGCHEHQRFHRWQKASLAALTQHPKVTFADYERRLQSLQATMQSIQQAYLGTPERAVVVLEGWDTAGKGGIVRRLGWALDPRSFRVYPIAAPRLHEQGRHYLQRFWQKLPGPGQIVVFDRSWYGRVLVERVEEFASKREWTRGYDEINRYERMMVDDGIRLVKCFLHITATADPPLQGPRRQPAQALEALSRGFSQPGAFGRL